MLEEGKQLVMGRGNEWHDIGRAMGLVRIKKLKLHVGGGVS